MTTSRFDKSSTNRQRIVKLLRAPASSKKERTCWLYVAEALVFSAYIPAQAVSASPLRRPCCISPITIGATSTACTVPVCWCLFMSNTRWSASDDAKLARLLKDGTINTNDSLAKEVIEQIRLKYFPIAQYKNFRPLLLKKCQKWRLNQSLSGARARCK